MPSPGCITWLHKCPMWLVRHLWSLQSISHRCFLLSTDYVGKLGCLKVAALSTQKRGLFFPWAAKKTSVVELTWDSVHPSSTVVGRCRMCWWWCSLLSYKGPAPAGLVPNQKMWAMGSASPWTGSEDCRTDPADSTAALALPRTRLARIMGAEGRAWNQAQVLVIAAFNWPVTDKNLEI